MTIEFKLPDLGENVESGDVVSVLVAEGQEIRAEQNVLELETDKAVVELPCPHAGRILKVHVKAGDRIEVGRLLLTLDGDSVAKVPATASVTEAPEAPLEETPATRAETPEASPSRAKEPADRAPAPETAPPPAPPEPAAAWRPPAPAGPATRRLARELGVDLYQVKGSARGGRITPKDVKDYVRSIAKGAPGAGLVAGAPLPDFATWGPVERRKLTGIRRKTAEAVSTSWRLVPHVTQFDLADITELESARKHYEKSRGEKRPKMTVTVLALKACVAALKRFPRCNASLDLEAEELVKKAYHHLGVAVDTEHGLLVPVIRNVDQKNLADLALELEDLAARARERKLDLEELQGGTFTITNLGGIGGTGFTPIVRYPEVAILGIARARWELVPRGDDATPERRLMLPLSLSYDHRVIDGADGARFLRYVAELLSVPFQLMVEI